MQHKSLFAALLCGTLCLTACLKNEESPSVTTVRLAKATELESIAARNNADAYAIRTLADANAALLNAQAKLQEANIKLVDADVKIKEAQAKQILAQAELAQVQVDIAKVQLDEEKINLQAKEKELAKLIAEYEAAIAQSQTEKLYWEYMRQLLDKELEIALVEAEAALARAQADLAAAQSELNEALRAAEEVEHQAEIAAQEQKAQEIAALRAKVEELAARYYVAAIDMLDIEEELLHEQAQIVKAQEGIASATEIKGEMIEANNRQIARLQKYLDYAESLEMADPEDVRDLLVDLDIAYEEQYAITEAAYNDYLAVYYQVVANIPNEVGVESDSPYWDVTYAFTQEFFVPEAGEPNVAFLSDIDYFYEPDNADMEHYGWIHQDVDDDNITHVYIGRETYDYAAYEYSIEDTELYSYYNDGTGFFGIKETPKRYPELGEGIVYDVREPYTTYYETEFIPMTINRDGYQAYVDLATEALEADRATDLADMNDYYDYYEAVYTQYKERFEKFLDVEGETITKMDKVVDDTVDQFVKDWNAAKAKYDAYYSAVQEYIKTYEMDNRVERTQAYLAWAAAEQAYNDKLGAAEYTDLKDAQTDAALVALGAALGAGIAELQKEYFEDDKWEYDGTDIHKFQAGGTPYTYNDWEWDVYYAKNAAGQAENDFKQAQKDLTDAQTNLNTASSALTTAEANYEDALAKYYDALEKLGTAEQAWYAAGAPASGALYDAKETAYTAYFAAQAVKNTAEAAVAPLKADETTAKATLTTAQSNYDIAKKAFDDATKALQDLLDFYPKWFDDQINEFTAAATEAAAAFEAAKAAVEAYEAELKDLADDRDAKLQAWKDVSGDAEVTKINDLYDAWYDAINNLGDPVFNMIYNYGLIIGLDLSINDNESYEFETYAPFPMYNDPEFDPEEYVYELMYEAIQDFYGQWIPSVSHDFFERYTEVDDIDENNIMAWTLDVDNYMNFMGQSPLGVWFMAHHLMGDYADGSMDSEYGDEYSSYLDIPYLEDMLAEFPQYRAEDEAYINEYYDEEIAALDAILDKIDAVLANEAVYTNAIDELNTLAAQIPDLWIAFWENDQLLGQIEDTYYVYQNFLANAEAFAEFVKGLKQEIKDLEEDNADWEDITEMEHALTKLEGKYALDQEMYEVAKALLASVKAEYEAAYAELKATLE